MSLSVSSRMARVKPSPTGATLALAARLRAAGRDILSLGAGEPDFDTPQHIKAAAIAAIERGETKYTPIDGTAELKEAIQRKFRRDNGLEYAPSQILVSAGGKQSLFNLCLALLDPGDEAIIPAPYWVSYPDMVRVADATPVIIDTGIDSGFRISPAQLASALSPRTRLLILNSPSNPTGSCYTAAEFAALGEVLRHHENVVIAADDMYEHICWAAEPFASFASVCPDLEPRTVTCNGVSKAYAMTGWRIGYAAGPEPLIRAMSTIQSQSTSNPCSISQAAATVALDGPQDCVAEMCAAYRRRHDYLVAALNDLDGIRCHPGDGAFYVFPHIQAAAEKLGLDDDIAFAEHLINTADLACVPGSAFGAPGYVRISYACSRETLREAIRRLKGALSA
jgi:aspartate aminotransferase